MSFAVSRSVVAATGGSPSLFSSIVGMSGSPDIRILSALEGDSRVTCKQRRIRRALIAVAMGVACIGLFSIGWGYRVGDNGPRPALLADAGNGPAAGTDQVLRESRPAVQGQASALTAVDGSPRTSPAPQAPPVKSVELPSHSERSDRAAVIIDTVAARAKLRTVPAVAASKAPARNSPSKSVTKRRKAATRPAVNVSALRVTPTRALQPSATAQVADDPDVHIIEAIVTRSR